MRRVRVEAAIRRHELHKHFRQRPSLAAVNQLPDADFKQYLRDCEAQLFHPETADEESGEARDERIHDFAALLREILNSNRRIASALEILLREMEANRRDAHLGTGGLNVSPRA